MIGRWYPRDTPPKVRREVLVFDAPIFIVGVWDGHVWRSAETWCELTDVRGWMPLPEKPKDSPAAVQPDADQGKSR